MKPVLTWVREFESLPNYPSRRLKGGVSNLPLNDRLVVLTYHLLRFRK